MSAQLVKGHNHNHHNYNSIPRDEPVPETAIKMDARTAFKKGDVQASIIYHKQQREMHGSDAANNYLKSLVYGGLDGIITTFATVTSVAGAELSAVVIVILGIAHLFADGLSMGMGDALSSQAELDFNNAERKREKWEMTNNMEGEVEEMIALYMKKGITRDDATTIITTLSKYEDAFLDHMMVEELGLMPPDPDDSPLRAGAVTMGAFIIFGCVPLLPYLIAMIPGVVMSADTQLTSAIVATLATLFLLGALKGSLIEQGQNWIWSGMVMVLNGSFAAFVGFIIGYVLKNFFGVN